MRQQSRLLLDLDERSATPFEGLETDKPVMLAYIDSVDPGS
ncbi:hypothetical protein [Pseudomonas sp. TNT2022 ID1044]|nr:hypothetical protein [Pseudomonas sp. TNT2022 ID1044]